MGLCCSKRFRVLLRTQIAHPTSNPPSPLVSIAVGGSLYELENHRESQKGDVRLLKSKILIAMATSIHVRIEALLSPTRRSRKSALHTRHVPLRSVRKAMTPPPEIPLLGVVSRNPVPRSRTVLGLFLGLLKLCVSHLTLNFGSQSIYKASLLYRDFYR